MRKANATFVIWSVAVAMCSGCAATNPVDTQKVLELEQHVKISAAQQSALLAAIAAHATEGLFVIPNIPEKMKLTVRKRYILPADEEILAIIDATILGSAANGLVIGQTGVYVRNDWTGSSPGRHFLPYSKYCTLGIEQWGFYEVYLGGLGFDMNTCTMSKGAVVSLLRDVRETLRETR